MRAGGDRERHGSRALLTYANPPEVFVLSDVTRHAEVPILSENVASVAPAIPREDCTLFRQRVVRADCTIVHPWLPFEGPDGTRPAALVEPSRLEALLTNAFGKIPGCGVRELPILDRTLDAQPWPLDVLICTRRARLADLSPDSRHRDVAARAEAVQRVFSSRQRVCVRVGAVCARARPNDALILGPFACRAVPAVGSGEASVAHALLDCNAGEHRGVVPVRTHNTRPNALIVLICPFRTLLTEPISMLCKADRARAVGSAGCSERRVSVVLWAQHTLARPRRVLVLPSLARRARRPAVGPRVPRHTQARERAGAAWL
eukprot:36390-Rhodomonas_salina.4